MPSLAHRLLIAALLPAAAASAAAPPQPSLKALSYGDSPQAVASLCVPATAAAPRPGVVLIHGGGWAAGSRHEFEDPARWFCANGAVAMSIDYRLAPASRWPAQLEDARDAVWWLREHAAGLQVDPARIAALGGSAGAHLAAWLGTTDAVNAAGTHSRVNAVVSLWGPWDLTVDGLSDDARNTIAALVGDQPPKSASPIFRIDARSAPTLFMHGTADALVPPDQSKRACDALRGAGVRCDLVLLDGEPHAPQHTDAAMLLARIGEFLSAVMPAGGRAASMPVVVDRYSACPTRSSARRTLGSAQRLAATATPCDTANPDRVMPGSVSSAR